MQPPSLSFVCVGWRVYVNRLNKFITRIFIFIGNINGIVINEWVWRGMYWFRGGGGCTARAHWTATQAVRQCAVAQYGDKIFRERKLNTFSRLGTNLWSTIQIIKLHTHYMHTSSAAQRKFDGLDFASINIDFRCACKNKSWCVCARMCLCVCVCVRVFDWNMPSNYPFCARLMLLR